MLISELLHIILLYIAKKKQHLHLSFFLFSLISVYSGNSSGVCGDCGSSRRPSLSQKVSQITIVILYKYELTLSSSVDLQNQESVFYSNSQSGQVLGQVTTCTSDHFHLHKLSSRSRQASQNVRLTQGFDIQKIVTYTRGKYCGLTKYLPSLAMNLYLKDDTNKNFICINPNESK